MNNTAAAPMTHIRLLMLSAIVVASFVLRYVYVHTAVVDNPLRGDAWQYFCYAWNLLKHGTFSLARPLSGAVTPDSFRDPGYPVFFASLMAIRGTGREVYDTLLLVQCLLGTATVAIWISLANRYLGFAAAFATGILLGAWPHLVSFTGYVLSETFLGFLLASALWLLDTALRRRSRIIATASGLAFSAAALTNAVVLPMAPLLAVIMLWKDPSRRAFWLTFLIACTLPSAMWIARNTTLPTGTSANGRAAINLVQGSWPEYHTAAFSAIQLHDPHAQIVMATIDREASAMQFSWSQGLPLLWHRFSADPLKYVRWYTQKPALLWSWDVAVGQGDIYVFPTGHSPFEENVWLRAWEGVCFVLNPWLALLALLGVAQTLRSHQVPLVIRWTGAIVVLATVTFVLLQAEPRYAVPYRGMEIILAITAAITLCRAIAHRRASASA
ncbi:ArnT family glycosyltransferase [Luteibacter sp. RCC_6_2]|uniref:ArnT family glycosyltransferase n=1 Tax=Luteibacter sp. RCC_6_2 TaxID=3239223 RepID=UPI003525F319